MAQVIVNPNFDAVTLKDDIALIELDVALTLDATLNPVCFPTVDIGLGLEADLGISLNLGVGGGLLGGVTGSIGNLLSVNLDAVLNGVGINLLTHADCIRDSLFDANQLIGGKICAVLPASLDVCQVNVGGKTSP